MLVALEASMILFWETYCLNARVRGAIACLAHTPPPTHFALIGRPFVTLLRPDANVRRSLAIR